ncbi:hypothetical protein [Salirhabdus sp. Marseille-P4669]|uniref:hypothetical protein n=1 Tax=Salirhabdus sp. Marseille-P4669 TaxID=2042310 RepID=UPI000C7B4E4A|nr:hypothetical protein [Salirhabdus sp. Marseille-P4669]
MNNRLRCPICKMHYKATDRVVLDILNTVIHQRCYNSSSLEILDKGTYKYILDKYSFLNGVSVAEVQSPVGNVIPFPNRNN